ncbi:MAG: prepilin-type N-terminal cleavage/methylation domain-containing protein [Acidobacteria bacterium]|nr:prepilin-type N-terminal cleavage/methylation domain-containing protein [Acidobacteriota bacterium]
MQKRNRRGFSLIELLIVIAIILIIAAIAIPRLGQARRAAYEMAAIRTLSTLNTAQVQYFSTYGRYAQTLQELGPPPGSGAPGPNAADLIPNNLATGLASGYVFTMVGTPAGYTVNADPQSESTGVRHFYTDHSNVIRQNSEQAASEADQELQ